MFIFTQWHPSSNNSTLYSQPIPNLIMITNTKHKTWNKKWSNYNNKSSHCKNSSPKLYHHQISRPNPINLQMSHNDLLSHKPFPLYSPWNLTSRAKKSHNSSPKSTPNPQPVVGENCQYRTRSIWKDKVFTQLSKLWRRLMCLQGGRRIKGWLELMCMNWRGSNIMSIRIFLT